MRKTNLLLGATKENELVFADIEITKRNGYKEFTASFNTVKPFKEEDVDLEELAEDVVDCFSDADLYCICRDNDIPPSELPEYFSKDGVEGLMDLSLYPDTLFVNNEAYRFESRACGQHDTREEMQLYTNKKAYDQLHELWDSYHLKEIDDNIENKVISIIEELESIKSDEWISNYIKEMAF